jgi:hypothetical protein
VVAPPTGVLATPLNGATGPSYNTVIVDDSQTMPGVASILGVPVNSAGSTAGTLYNLAQNSHGVVVDVGQSVGVQELTAQAAADPTCVYAVDLEADAIQAIINSFRNASPDNVQDVVVVGDDDVIPFFRYSDAEPVAPEDGYSVPLNSVTEADAALANDYYLSDDQYGATTELSLDATTLPVENVPVGRLVTTPTEIAGIIQDYLTNSTITPKSTLATGYSFMEPAAQTIAGDFAAGNQQAGAENDTLLDGGTAPGTDTDWTAADLQSELQTPHQLVFLGAHFNENGAEAADGSALWTSQLSLGSNLQNSLVISAGCHSGYAVDRADAVNGLTGLPSWPEEFASAGATLIAGTGYQYGDSNYTAYSDQYYVDLAGQLAGRTVSVGGAMLQSQYQYLADLDGLNSLTEKSLLEVTLYGLPMLKITTGGGQSAAQTTPGVFTLPGTGNTAPTSTVPSGPGNALGLYEADVTVPTASLTQGSVDQAGPGRRPRTDRGRGLLLAQRRQPGVARRRVPGRFLPRHRYDRHPGDAPDG